MAKNILRLVLILNLFLAGCSTTKQINRLVKNDLLSNPAFISAHTGISIYEPATGRYWYNLQGNKYFIPASNTKLATCYAGMKYLGDSLAGIYYRENDDILFVAPAGDPTFLHPDFSKQRTFDFLKNSKKQIMMSTVGWQEERWGGGWSWDDYNDYYAAERSAMPIYGNILKLSGRLNNLIVSPAYFKNSIHIDTGLNLNLFPGEVHRNISENKFWVTKNNPEEHYTETPFYTGNDSVLINLFSDTLHKIILKDSSLHELKNANEKVLYSQPTDSMLKPLMHRSDNFFAEQTLLMVSNKLLGIMNDEKIIDTLLKSDFKDLPQKPNWVDGSGLSHYNLFSPQDFVTILNKIKNEFGMDRIKNILATGGTGTIKNYYKADSGFIYAKTGTLSGVVALSGFLYTKKNKLLIFSTLVNNHNSNSTIIRRGIEKFIEEVRNRN